MFCWYACLNYLMLYALMSFFDCWLFLFILFACCSFFLLSFSPTPPKKNTRTDVERSKIIFRTTYQNIKYRFIIQILNKVNTLFMFINLI